MTAVERARRYRARRRQNGDRLLRLWLPDTSNAAFRDECRRQAKLLRSDPAEVDHVAWVEAAAASLDFDG